MKKLKLPEWMYSEIFFTFSIKKWKFLIKDYPYKTIIFFAIYITVGDVYTKIKNDYTCELTILNFSFIVHFIGKPISVNYGILLKDTALNKGIRLKKIEEML
jgi:hypothetical protein